MLGLIQVLGCTLGLVLVNKLGCRGLLLNSLAFCSLTMTALAISIHMKWQWMSLIMLILFTFSFMSGLSNVPWVLVGELPTGKYQGNKAMYIFWNFLSFFILRNKEIQRKTEWENYFKFSQFSLWSLDGALNFLVFQIKRAGIL